MINAHTEEEARKLWCPHARVLSEGGSYNRGTEGQASAHARCLGAQCMAWRWLASAAGLSRQGYCGLAEADR